MWVWAAFVPHPPVVVPQVGGARRHGAEKTLLGFELLRQRLEPQTVDHLLLFSPHFRYAEALVVDGSDLFEGDLASFGAPSISVRLSGAPEEARRLADHVGLTMEPFLSASRICPLDHGTVVPLTMLASLLHAGQKAIVANAVGLTPREAFALGRRLRSFGGEGRWGLLASGDLSHCLAHDGPYGFRPEGPLFEKAVEEAASRSSPEPLFALSSKVVSHAGHCGLNSFLILLGLAGSLPLSLHSHEWPFGVGYLTASVLFGYPETLLARRAVEHFLETSHQLPPGEARKEIPHPSFWSETAACFVSIKSRSGDLRGCMGTVEPASDTLGEEILSNAVMAACHDPRFNPLSAGELPSMRFSVDILSKPEPITDLSLLDPRCWGVIVESRGRRGVLLPDLEGVDTVEAQIDIARRKAGISKEMPLSLHRFRVDRFNEASR